MYIHITIYIIIYIYTIIYTKYILYVHILYRYILPIMYHHIHPMTNDEHSTTEKSTSNPSPGGSGRAPQGGWLEGDAQSSDGWIWRKVSKPIPDAPWCWNIYQHLGNVNLFWR